MNNPSDNVPTYVSVISRELVHILFLIDDLYDIKFLGADIRNDFLITKCTEKVCFKAGTEFTSREGMWVIIVRTLYGINISGASFRAHLANTLWTMGFKPTISNPDVWMPNNFLPLPKELNSFVGNVMAPDTTGIRSAPNPSKSALTYGTPYYDYICTWGDDLLTVFHYTTTIMLVIGYVYKLKEINGYKDHWDLPKRYLGAYYGDYEMSNGTNAWYMISDSYLNAAVNNVESQLA